MEKLSPEESLEIPGREKLCELNKKFYALIDEKKYPDNIGEFAWIGKLSFTEYPSDGIM